MKRLIATLSAENAIRYYPEFCSFFKEAPLKEELFNFDAQYFYKENNGFFPIINNYRWGGDFLNANGEVVLTRDKKIQLYGSSVNPLILRTSVDKTAIIHDHMFNIIKDFSLYYLATASGIDRASGLELFQKRFNKSFFNNWDNLSFVEQEDYIAAELYKLFDVVTPGIINVLSEIVGSYLTDLGFISFESEYNVFSIYHEYNLKPMKPVEKEDDNLEQHILKTWCV